jgi:hypothetical protein
MKNSIHTIEDLLEILAGLQQGPKVQIEPSDATIMYSIARQVFKGTALTDRQLSVVKEKLQTYKEQFLEIDFDLAIENLRMPLRHIDRSKYIKIVDTADVYVDTVYESYKEKWKWIKIRFPFSKKLIVSLESISKESADYQHKKGSHEHYFLLNEVNTVNVIDAFKDKSFDIDQELLDWYEKLKDMKNNKEQYLPGIYNFKLKNLNEKAINYMVSTLGDPNIENLSLYKDRSESLGLEHFDTQDLDKSINMLTTLSQKIVKRTKSNVLVNKNHFNIHNLCETLLELNRFPLLVVLPESNPLEPLHKIHNGLSGFIDSSESSVLFRLETHTNYEFNNYVKQQKLNSPLDKSLKVVYINNNKIPKPLIKSGWNPLTVLLMDSARPHTNVGTYINEADLVIHYDETMSQFMRFQKNGIQEL